MSQPAKEEMSQLVDSRRDVGHFSYEFLPSNAVLFEGTDAIVEVLHAGVAYCYHLCGGNMEKFHLGGQCVYWQDDCPTIPSSVLRYNDGCVLIKVRFGDIVESYLVRLGNLLCSSCERIVSEKGREQADDFFLHRLTPRTRYEIDDLFRRITRKFCASQDSSS